MAADDKTIPVIVAVRARPFSKKEKEEGAISCVEFGLTDNQIIISGRSFCFDHLFDQNSKQDVVYEMCAEPLIDRLFQGYNCTIFAYGQTGSGKTYTMGTESSSEVLICEEKGIIPRIVESIFNKIDQFTEQEVVVQCSMLEIYEERVIDLLCELQDRSELFIREHPEEGIFVQNLSRLTVKDFKHTLRCLEQGCLSRTKGETAMNSKSSRSHAIFTIYIKHALSTNGNTFCQAKLHLVDLAGSERLKKTQAVGERKREGIKINEGLLALGNVISALTDVTQQRSHIPYRDSRLTRLLQDSLGGNTYTVMISCISAADSNYDETLSTLRYAERAKKIKNKPTVNIDIKAKELAQLRLELEEVKRQLLTYQTGHETSLTYADKTDVESMRREVEKFKSENQSLSNQLTQSIVEHAMLVEKTALLQEKLHELQEDLSQNASAVETCQNDPILSQNANVRTCIQAYQQVRKKLSDLQSQSDDISSADDGSFDKENEDVDDFDEDKFRSRQNAASRQLEILLKQIQNKEKLIQESAMNVEQMEQLKINHQKEMASLKEKVDTVQKEREELERQLHSASVTSKLSESRRKRMAELEKQISDYRKKISELQKFEKIKLQCDQNMSKMREEVLALKQQRVQLVRQLRSDSQRFKEWQLKTEKQMNQMRVKEKRREYEAQVAKRNFDQQLNVHRRKYEEAVAFSKRLQGQLQRQTSAQKGRFTEIHENEKLVKEIKDFLEKELELMASTEEAKIHCDSLLKQRKELNSELQKCEKKYARMLKEPTKEKSGPNDDVRSNYVEAEALQAKIESLRREIGLSTSEIKELRQKISAVDTNQLEERRWVGITSLVQARCAIKQLFSMTVNTRVECLQFEHQLSDLQMNYDLLSDNLKQKDRKVDEVDRLLAEKDRKFQDEMSKVEIEYNKKLSLLLQHLYKLTSGDVNDDEIRKIIQMQCKEAEKLQLLTEQLSKKTSETEHLTKELSKAKVRQRIPRSGNFFSTVSNKKRKSGSLDGLDENVEEQEVKRSRSSRIIKLPQRFGLESGIASISAVLEDSQKDRSDFDESTDDSDYRETPLHKRVHKIINRESGARSLASKAKRKRSVQKKTSGIVTNFCGCKRGNCSSCCGCTKKAKKCTDSCLCSPEFCTNRVAAPEKVKAEAQNDCDERSDDDNGARRLNDTFVKEVHKSNPQLTSTPIESAPLKASNHLGGDLNVPQKFTSGSQLTAHGLKNFSPSRLRAAGSLFTPLTPSTTNKFFGGL